MKNSKIEWCHHTFNCWWGCVKVSPGCEHCYAETLSKRTGHNIWGPAKTTDRRLFGDKHWAEPLKWNKQAKEAGERHRVFCASMADVFEDHPQVLEARARLLDTIVSTPHLDWLLLTKRPENVNHMIEETTGYSDSSMWFFVASNVWIGTSVEDQATADQRIPYLLEVPAAVRFLSCEPLLGPVNLGKYLPWQYSDGNLIYPMREVVHWVIVGGESGHHARPMHPDWARDLRDQCQATGTAFFFKQWGEHWPVSSPPANPRAFFQDGQWFVPVGKGVAGRELDGETWSQFPATNTTIEQGDLACT